MSIFDDINSIRDEWNEKRNLFDKLNIDRCCDIPKVGQRVVVSAFLLGMGFEWEFKEATVLEVGSQAYKIQLNGSTIGRPFDPQWISPALVVEVLEDE